MSRNRLPTLDRVDVDLPDAAERTVKRLRASVRSGSDRVGPAIERIGDEVPALADRLRSDVPAIVERVRAGAVTALDRAREDVPAALGRAQEEIPVAVDRLREDIPATVDRLVAGAPDVPGAVAHLRRDAAHVAEHERGRASRSRFGSILRLVLVVGGAVGVAASWLFDRERGAMRRDRLVRQLRTVAGRAANRDHPTRRPDAPAMYEPIGADRGVGVAVGPGRDAHATVSPFDVKATGREGGLGEQVRASVRAAVGGQVSVDAEMAGTSVILHGEASTADADAAARAAASVPGVTSVDSRIATPENRSASVA